MANFSRPDPKRARLDSTSAKRAQMAKSALQQVLDEPAEILKSAGEQISGTRVENETSGQAPAIMQIPQPSAEERNKKERLEAFRRELAEIQQIQRRREQERQQLRSQEDAEKKKREEARTQSLPEPEGKRPRGVMLGMAGAIKRKQNRVEMQKTPSN